MGFYHSVTSFCANGKNKLKDIKRMRILNEFRKCNQVTISFAVNKDKAAVFKIEPELGRNLFHTDLMVFI